MKKYNEEYIKQLEQDITEWKELAANRLQEIYDHQNKIDELERKIKVIYNIILL